MTNQKNTPEKAAEELGASGLFKNRCIISKMEKHCPWEQVKHGVVSCIGCKWEATPYLDADQAEEILGKMGLQVVYLAPTYADGFWALSRLKAWNNYSPTYANIYYGHISYLKDIPKGHRTHANNAALAYCCENMFDELKLVMEEG